MSARQSDSTSRVVLVDMDGVLADFDAAVLAALPSLVDRVPRTNFYIARDYPAHVDVVKEIYSRPRFFYDLEPVEGAVEGWRRLLELGYEPRICTAPLTSNPQSAEGKIAWLQEHFVPHFGREVVETAIVDKLKFNHDGIALIDDRPDPETDNGRATWRHVVFDRPYNQSSVSEFRISGWSDPELDAVLTNVLGTRAS